MELLIVISIIGILTLIALPGVKGMKQSNVMNAANRQLLDDLALARQMAIKNRSEVSIVFAPLIDPATMAPPVDSRTMQAEDPEPLILGQLTSYRLFARRTVGDQPGRPTERYLTGWKELPDGVFVAKEKFIVQPQAAPQPPQSVTLNLPLENRTITTFGLAKFPYPTSTNGALATLAYMTFDPQGRVAAQDATLDGRVIIPLARGGMLHTPNPTGKGHVWEEVDARENPQYSQTNNYNFIVIDALTGRARVERPEIQ